MTKSSSRPEILLNNRSIDLLQYYLSNPHHGLILKGLSAIDLAEVSKWLTREFLGSINALNFLEIEPGKNGNVGIDEVKHIADFLKLKNTSERGRLIIVNSADNLTIEAQNSFLKLLEEPPEQTLFILLCENDEAILNTIKSRSQTINLKAPTFEQVLEKYKDQNHKDLKKAYLISEGSPVLLEGIIKNNIPVDSSLETAKHVLSSKIYDRLIYKYPDSRQDIQQILNSTIRLLRQVIRSRAKKGQNIDAQLKMLSSALEAENAINQNGNVKIHLDLLFLQLAGYNRTYDY